jgi:uncharacterized phage protein (TIGR01671 family)
MIFRELHDRNRYLDSKECKHVKGTKPSDRGMKVMEFTGFLDKNGIEIYEGDVVNSKYEIFGTDDGKKYYGTGRFKSHKSQVVKFEEGAFWAGGLMKGQEFEIIGNIFQPQ